MKYLFDDWGKIESLLRARYVFLFLDYDGTLVPIAPRPQDAVLPVSAKEVLFSLAHTDRISLAIISGRALADIKNMVGVDHIAYVGNHGLEVDGFGIKFENFVPPEVKAALQRIKTALDLSLREIPGVLVEDKELSLSVHYRLVEPEYIAAVKTAIDKVMTVCPDKKYFLLHGGKKVWEIRPVSQFDKGKVVMWLLARENLSLDKDILPVYIGDDITDEDAFGAVKKTGLTIRVGQSDDSQADYCVNDTGEVEDFLFHILQLRQAK